ncbi:MAG TPA: metalloregulator ArsR/SmtB family transcription factor [Candidatus Xenobia bacterium]|nr:metalloregulator ArsR/SmtB family transcription factor [Candidatus Xenobia bacterium]
MRSRRQGARAVAHGDVFQAISDPTRRRLVERLSRSELSVNALARPFRMSRPAISQHLRVLRRAGLVRVRRAGRERYYRLYVLPLRRVHDWVSHYERFWKDKLTALGKYLEETP